MRRAVPAGRRTSVTRRSNEDAMGVPLFVADLTIVGRSSSVVNPLVAAHPQIACFFGTRMVESGSRRRRAAAGIRVGDYFELDAPPARS
jgi:hypothetical protein